MVDAVEAFGNVSVEHPFGFRVDADIERANRIPGGASRSKALTGRLKAGLPVRG
jgi:hypothetical protein